MLTMICESRLAVLLVRRGRYKMCMAVERRDRADQKSCNLAPEDDVALQAFDQHLLPAE